MARLNTQLDSDDELPELFSILGIRTEAFIRQPKTPRQEHSDNKREEKEGQNLTAEDLTPGRHVAAPEILTKVYSDRPRSKKQRPLGHLKQAQVDSLLFPTSEASVNTSKTNDSQSIEAVDGVSPRASPRRLANGLADSLGKMSANTFSLIHDDSSYTDLSGFVVPDSANDGELPVSKPPERKKKKMKKKKQQQKQKYQFLKISATNPYESSSQQPRQPQAYTQQLSETIDLTFLDEKKGSRTCVESLPSSESFISELVEKYPSLDKRPTL